MFVKHAHVDATFFKVIDLLHNWLRTIVGREFNLDLSWLCHHVILAPVLVSEGVSSNDNWRSPAWNESRDIRDDDRLSEDGAVEDVSDSSIWRFPHLLKAELFDTTSIRSDGGTLNGNFVFFSSIGRINRDLIICCIARLYTQVVVFNVEIYVGMDVLNIE